MSLKPEDRPKRPHPKPQPNAITRSPWLDPVDAPPVSARLPTNDLVLVMLAHGIDLPKQSHAAALLLRRALDRSAPQGERLDATEALHEAMIKLPLGQRCAATSHRHIVEMLREEIDSVRLTEMHVDARFTELGMSWCDLLRPDLEWCFAANDQRKIYRVFSFDKLHDLLKRYVSADLGELVADREDALALIRLMYGYAAVLHTGIGIGERFHGSDGQDELVLIVDSALAQWERIEQRLPGLPVRTPGLMLLPGDVPPKLSSCTRSSDAQASELEHLIAASRVHRVEFLAQVHAKRQKGALPGSGAAGITGQPAADANSTRPVMPIRSDPPAVANGALLGSDVARVFKEAAAAAAQAQEAHLNGVLARYPGLDPYTVADDTMHQVIVEPISVPAGKEDRLQAASYDLLRQQLPLAVMPTAAELAASIEQLHREFPWATQAIDLAAGEMLARRRLGALNVSFAPSLLVGPPGSGKSRLARRLAETLGLGFLPLSVGGNSDGRQITGTARGWSNGEPSQLIRRMRDLRVAQMLVLLDEIDKCSYTGTNSPPMHSVLLGLLEPENARRWVDSYLQVPCDLSKLLYVATANGLDGIDMALRSRLQPVLVPAPNRKHFPLIAEMVVAEVAQHWGLPREVMPEIDVSGLARHARNLRELQGLVRQEIVRATENHGPAH